MRTAEGVIRSLSSKADGMAAVEGRRGSLPHLAYGSSHHAPRSWNPSLPPQRGSVSDDIPDDDYKFGTANDIGHSPAEAALKSMDVNGVRLTTWIPSISGKRRESKVVFEEAEAEEAERQQRAFLAATYGGDSRRARERLSIGGSSHTIHGENLGTPNESHRRQTLLIWERMNMTATTAVETDGSADAPYSAPASSAITPVESTETPAQRRGSVPIAIPGDKMGRSPTRRSAKAADMDAQPRITDTDDEDDAVDEADEDLASLSDQHVSLC